MTEREWQALLMVTTLLGVLLFSVVSIVLWKRIYGDRVRKEIRSKYERPKQVFDSWTPN